MVQENVDENSSNVVKVNAADLEHAPANLLEGVEVLRAFGKVKVMDARTLSDDWKGSIANRGVREWGKREQRTPSRRPLRRQEKRPTTGSP